ncbi:hypothetical protein [Candidatus Hodarchaeum mangrovi]
MIDPLNLGVSILAVRWDDITGPSIISLFPPTELVDPESIALQIYLASVTVFGQHGQSQRTEFSVPMLSLGHGVTARVAFDAWPDQNLRGKERPFFLAFILEQETEKYLHEHLDLFIFNYLDILKIKEDEFNSQEIWNKLIETFTTHEDKKYTKLDENNLNIEYSIPRATQDVDLAYHAWTKTHDRNQLWTALKAANRLEHVNDNKAGEAFKLAGHIFFEGRNYHDAKDAYEKGSNAFARARTFEMAGECSALAGRCAYLLQEYQKAIELLQAGSLWINDSSNTAALNYDMGIVLHEQNRFEEAYSCFEKAIKLISELDALNAAKYSATFASKLFIHSETEKKENIDYSLSLLRRSAAQREKVAKFLLKIDGKIKNAASSLILATSSYFALGEYNKAIELLEESTRLFIEIEDYTSASKSLYEGARAVKNDLESSLRLLNQATSLVNKMEEGIHKFRLLGSIFFEIGQIERKKNRTLPAFNAFKSALENLKKSSAAEVDLIPVHIQIANYYFAFEEFEEAARFFLEANELLKSLPEDQIQNFQQEKVILNAAISLRRASNAYHYAAFIVLKTGDELKSIDLFTRSIALLLEWRELAIHKSPEEVIKVFNDRISVLSIKKDFLLLAESKYKVETLINSLKIAQVLTDEN